VESTPGEGSTLTLFLPENYIAPATRRGERERDIIERPVERRPSPAAEGARGRAPLHTDDVETEARGPRTEELNSEPEAQHDEPLVVIEEQVPDDRDSIQPGDRTVLITEDDVNFARILLDMAREKGFKGIVATRGEVAINLAKRYRPDAITLDVALPDMEGWTVLDRLKHDRATRHIPVHIISADDEVGRGLRLGAFATLQKPVTKDGLDEAFKKIRGFVERSNKSLLIIEDDESQRQAIGELIGGEGDVEISTASSGEEALGILRERRFDCIVLDLGLPDMSGFDFINRMKSELHIEDIPIVVYTGRELSRKEESDLKRIAEAIIVKDVSSPDRLLDETALFLHRVEANLPEHKRQMLEQLHESDPVLAGKTALIVDDDIRNIFALTAILERQQMEVFSVDSGKEALETLERNPDVAIALVDVMMPEMDGYETMTKMRQMATFKDKPIIALTAKAMKGDREKCIEAGASDYIAKPVNNSHLLSMLRSWLSI